MRFVTRAAIVAAAALAACSGGEPLDAGDHTPPAASELPGGGESAEREFATAEQASRAWRMAALACSEKSVAARIFETMASLDGEGSMSIVAG